MADPVAVNDELMEEPDVEMSGAVGEFGEAADVTEGVGEELLDVHDTPKARIQFIDFLRSPIVELVVGSGAEAVVLSAHQDLLTKSPFFERECANLEDSSRRIDLPDDDVEAVGSFLEYLYMDEYFPKRTGSGRDAGVEQDPAFPGPDVTGEQLLKHARIYSLAEKFMMPALKSLAHSKIHHTTSTARGEIAYARYVYSTTNKEDTSIRKPIAAFWATRSHVLRHEAEEEFRAMCLQFPQFGFDVLSLVLDQKEKQRGGSGSGGSVAGALLGISSAGDSGAAVSEGTPGRGRKRARASGV